MKSTDVHHCAEKFTFPLIVLRRSINTPVMHDDLRDAGGRPASFSVCKPELYSLKLTMLKFKVRPTHRRDRGRGKYSKFNDFKITLSVFEGVHKCVLCSINK